MLQTLNKNRDYANDFLRYFVSTFIIIYGPENVTHNVHNLLHIAVNSKTYGSTEKYSAFPFENSMFFLKKVIRKGDQPVQQIVFRIHERKYAMRTEQPALRFAHLKAQHFQDPVLPERLCESAKQFKKICFENFVISIDNE